MSIELIDTIVSPYETLLREKGYTDLPGSLKENSITSALRYRVASYLDFPELQLPGEDSSEDMRVSTRGILGSSSVLFAFNFKFDLCNPHNYLDLKSLDVSINNQQSVNFPLKNCNELPDAEQVFQLAKLNLFQLKAENQKTSVGKRAYRT